MFILMNNCETQNLRFLGQLVSEIWAAEFYQLQQLWYQLRYLPNIIKIL